MSWLDLLELIDSSARKINSSVELGASRQAANTVQAESTGF